MKQGTVIKAYKALLNISEQSLPLNLSYKVFKLKRMLQPCWDFQLEKEKEIFTNYTPESIDGSNFKFDTPEKTKAFKESFDELANMDTDVEFQPIKIQISDKFNVSVNEIEALDGFVIFEGEGVEA